MMTEPSAPPDSPPSPLLGLILGITTLGCFGVAAALMLWPTRTPADRGGHWSAVEIGRAQLRAGRPDLALEAVSGVRDEAPGSGEAMAVAGQALLAMRQVRGARLSLERALRLQPAQPEVALILASLDLDIGDAQGGLRALKLAAEHDPANPRPWLAIARVHHDLGEPAEAASAYEELLRRDDGAHRLTEHAALIEEWLNANEADRATPWLERARRDRPDDPTLLGLAAWHARDLGRPEESRELADRCLALDPDNLNALLARARAHRAAGRAEAARIDLLRASKVNPNQMAVLHLLGQVEAQLGLAEQAAATRARHRKAQDRSIELGRLVGEIAGHPDDPAPRARMGELALEGGQAELASRCFQAALALDPNHAPSRRGLESLRELGTARP